MKYYVIAGEASGDLHGSNLIKELVKLDGSANFRAWGGELMQNAGATLVKHYRDLAFMGFVEVLKNIRVILKNIDFCKKDILAYAPDALILVDYPGFNLRIAEFAKQKGIKVFYYISPQIWAWKQSRVHKIKRIVDRMFVILPFEKPFYQKFDYDVDFVGHPLLDAIEDRSRYIQVTSNKPIIALLPGSRKQEISTMLPLMLSVKDKFPDHEFVIAGAPSIPLSFYEPYLDGQVKLISGQTYNLLHSATAALITSGTATLEAALFEVPEVVCYKGSFLSYHIAKRLIKVKFISLVNLIMDREIVKELIQDELNPTRIYEELHHIVFDKAHVSKLKEEYRQLKNLLGGGGASYRTAELIHSLSKQNRKSFVHQ